MPAVIRLSGIAVGFSEMSETETVGNGEKEVGAADSVPEPGTTAEVAGEPDSVAVPDGEEAKDDAGADEVEVEEVC